MRPHLQRRHLRRNRKGTFLELNIETEEQDSSRDDKTTRDDIMSVYRRRALSRSRGQDLNQVSLENTTTNLMVAQESPFSVCENAIILEQINKT
jgi:hypothetical protein